MDVVERDMEDKAGAVDRQARDGPAVTGLDGAGADRRAGSSARRYRQAGLTYLLGGAGVVAFTFAAGLVPAARAPRAFLLLPGLGFVVALGLLLTFAPTLFRFGLAEAATRWLARLLCVTSTGRTLLFLGNAAGLNVHFMRGGRPDFFVVTGDPKPLFLVCAALTGLIAAMLARAAWTRAA